VRRNGELGVFVPLSALHDGVGVAEPLDPAALDEAGETGTEDTYDGETPVMPEEWYQVQVARQPVVSSGRWGVDSQDVTDSGSLDAGRMARRNAGKAWSRLLRLGQPATLRQRLGGLALTAVFLVTLLGLFTALIFTIWPGGVAGWPPFSGARQGGGTFSCDLGVCEESVDRYKAGRIRVAR
jgi:hypothetical protein